MAIADFEKHQIQIDDLNKFCGGYVVFYDADAAQNGTTAGYFGADDFVSIYYPNGIADIKGVTVIDARVQNAIELLILGYCSQQGLINEKLDFQEIKTRYSRFDDKAPIFVDVQLALYDETQIAQLSNDADKAEAYHEWAYCLSQKTVFDAVEACVANNLSDQLSFLEAYQYCTQTIITSAWYDPEIVLKQFVQAYGYVQKSLVLKGSVSETNAEDRTQKLRLTIRRSIGSSLFEEASDFAKAQGFMNNTNQWMSFRQSIEAIYDENNANFWDNPHAEIAQLQSQAALPNANENDKRVALYFAQMAPQLTW